MLKAVKILSSSTSFRCVPLSHGLKKPHADLPLISRNPIKAPESFHPTSPRTDSSAFQFLNGCGFRAFQMACTHSESTPAGASSSASTPVQSTVGAPKINFCQWCGGPIMYGIPDGDDKVRAICTQCGKITYQNPKLVVGCLVEHENKILLCKRKIQPSYGLWTLPAGFMENGESAAQGAIRETLEEANAEVETVSPFAFLDIPLIGHNYLMFLANLKSPYFSPGPESLDCKLFALEDIPLDSLAFSSMLVTLKMYTEYRKVGSLRFHYGVINKRVAGKLRDHSQTSWNWTAEDQYLRAQAYYSSKHSGHSSSKSYNIASPDMTSDRLALGLSATGPLNLEHVKIVPGSGPSDIHAYTLNHHLKSGFCCHLSGATKTN